MLVAFGFQGQGKSSTLNKIIGGNAFSVGDGSTPKTKEATFYKTDKNENMSIDLVGIGDLEDRARFYESFMNKKNDFLDELSTFLLVVKFDNSEYTCVFICICRNTYACISFFYLIFFSIRDFF